MQRAFSTLTITKASADGREFEGIASTPSPDLGNDIVVPQGAQYTLPLPLLLGHDHSAPIGWVTSATITSTGIRVKGRVAQVDTPASLKDKLDTAWSSIRAGLTRGLSVGFKPLKSEPLPGGGRRFTSWLWLELSACVLPMNQEATILTVRSAFGQQRAAPRRKGVVYLDSSPVPRRPVVFLDDRGRR